MYYNNNFCPLLYSQHCFSLCSFCFAFSIGTLLTFFCFYEPNQSINRSIRSIELINSDQSVNELQPGSDLVQVEETFLLLQTSARRPLPIQFSFDPYASNPVVSDTLDPMEQSLLLQTLRSFVEAKQELDIGDSNEEVQGHPDEFRSRIGPGSGSISGLGSGTGSWIDKSESNRSHILPANNRSNSMDSLRLSNEQLQEVALKTVKSVKVFCLVLMETSSITYRKAIADTFGKRCDDMMFFGTIPSEKYNIHSLPDQTSAHSWISISYALHKVAQLEDLNQFDWLVLVPQDSFLIMQGLRDYVREFNSSVVHFFSHWVRENPWWIPFLSDGSTFIDWLPSLAAYSSSLRPSPKAASILSRGAVKLLLTAETNCNTQNSAISTANGLRKLVSCLEHMTGRDFKVTNHNNWRLSPIGPMEMMDKDSRSLRQDAVSFGQLQPKDIYFIDYMLYHVRVSGR